LSVDKYLVREIMDIAKYVRKNENLWFFTRTSSTSH
jgi:hypothetical protein